MSATHAVLDARVLKLLEQGADGFVIAPGVGQTYAGDAPTLYCWRTMPESSVLAGQSVRKFVHRFDELTDAQAWCESFNGRHPSTVRLDYPA